MEFLLNQALMNSGLAFLAQRGYTLLPNPFFMQQDVMAQSTKLAQFDEELYKVGTWKKLQNMSKDCDPCILCQSWIEGIENFWNMVPFLKRRSWPSQCSL